MVRDVLELSISVDVMEWCSVSRSWPLMVKMPVAPGAFHLPSLERRRRLIMKVGKSSMLPFHNGVMGSHSCLKASPPALVERSKGRLEPKRS